MAGPERRFVLAVRTSLLQLPRRMQDMRVHSLVTAFRYAALFTAMRRDETPVSACGPRRP